MGALFILSPFYFFRNGAPQIADILLALLALTTFLNGDLFKGEKPAKAVLFLSAFLVYVIGINLIWSFVLHDAFMSYKSLFYTFNVLVFILYIAHYERIGPRFSDVTFFAISASIGIQVLLSFLVPNSLGLRKIILFNDPNQLGYWALLCILFLLVRPYGRSERPPAVVPFLCGGDVSDIHHAVLFRILRLDGYAADPSVSAHPRLWKNKRLTAIAAVLVLGIVVAAQFSGWGPGQRIHRFVSSIVELRGHDIPVREHLVERGYDRIAEHPRYLLFGAGEGRFDRFHDPNLTDRELHSTLGNILFSYGIVGFGLFFLFLYHLYRNIGAEYLIYLVPPMIYGLMQNGIRETMLWIFLAFCYGVSRSFRDKKKVLKGLKTNKA